MGALDDFLDETPENTARPEDVSAPTATIAPEASQAIADYLDDDRDQLQYSIQQGAVGDSGQSIRILQAIGRTRLPREFVERNLDYVEKESARQEFDPDKFLRESPVVAEYLKDPVHAAAMREDYSRLSYLERQYRYIGKNFERGNQTVELSDIGQAAMLGTITPQQRARQAELEKTLTETDDQGLAGFFEQIPGMAAGQIPILGKTIEGKVKGAAEGTVIGAAAGATAGAATANPVLPAAGATMGAVTGWRYGAAVEAGKMEASLAFLDYEKLKDANGQPLDRQTVLGLAGIVGVVNGALEGLTGIERATDKLPWVRNFSRQGIKQLLASPSASGALLAYAKTVGAVMAEEGLTEGLQSMVTAAGKAIAKATGGPTDILGEIFSPENLTQAVAEARAGAQGGGGISVVLAAPTLAADLRQAKTTKQNEQAFLKMGQATQEAKAINQLPEHLQRIIQAATEEGPVETLYVPTQAFNQYFQSKGVDPRDVAEAITGNVESYDQAVATGADLAIRTSDYASKLAGTEHNAFFSKELRTAVDQMNAREAEEWVQMMDQQAKAQEGVTVTSANDPQAKIIQDITGQLQAIGFDPGIIDQYASLFAQRYRARAERRGLGEDPAELFGQANLTINRQIPEVLRSLGQKTSELDALLNRLRSGDLPRQTDIFGPSLSDFLREKGGVQDQGGELLARDVDGPRQAFQRKLVQKKGLTLDQAAEIAAEAGYIDERDVNTLLDALDKDARGNPVFAIGRENAQLFDVQQNLDALKDFLAARGIDLQTTGNERIKALLGEGIQQPLTVEGQTFAQGQADMVLTGRELGDFGDDLKAWKQAGLEFYSDLQKGGPVQHPTLGPVKFTRAGKLKLRQVTGSVLHWQMVAGLPDIVVKAQLIESRPVKDRTDDIVRFHWLETTVKVGDQVYQVGVNVAEDQRGNKFYNLNEDLETWRKKYKTPQGTQERQLGAEGSDEGETSSTFHQSVPPNQDGINLEILNQSVGPDAKGSITFADQQTIIQLFDGADLSTVLHESGHLYLNELIDDATTEGTPQALKDDLDTILKWMGLEVTSASGRDAVKAAVQTKQHEQFARGFEAYALEGLQWGHGISAVEMWRSAPAPAAGR